MKIAIVGGGSTYTPELLSGLAEAAPALGLTEVALYDLDPTRLGVVGAFSARMVSRIAPSLQVRQFPNRAEAIAGASFVVTQIRVGGQAARKADEELGRRFQVIGQETTGVGGLAKAIRTIPALIEIGRTIEREAPAATWINFTNPVSIVTEALFSQVKVRTIGLCNIPISQRRELAAHLGVSPDRVHLDSVGLNHLSFIRGVTVDGREVLPQLIEGLKDTLLAGARPANIPDLDFPPEMLANLRMIPSDYLRYFFLQKETIAEQAKKSTTRADEVAAIEAELLQIYADPAQHEKPASLSKRGGAHYSHAALEIIAAMCGEGSARLVVDVVNGSTVFELPPTACVEVPCLVGPDGARPLPQRPLEPAIRGLIQHVKAYEEQAVKAALSRDVRELYLAVLAHPLSRSAADARAIAEDIAQRSWRSR
ncbi:MAG: 6-phospho-beta-glucosidase [Myxococcota bacterium]